MACNKIKVAIYVRTAQEDKLEIDSQINELLKIYNNEKYLIYDIYVDNGFSCNDKNRPAYNRMIKDMKKGLFNLVVAKDISRITKSLYYIDKFNNLLSKYNCDVHFISEDVKSNEMFGKLCLKILETIGREFKTHE